VAEKLRSAFADRKRGVSEGVRPLPNLLMIANGSVAIINSTFVCFEPIVTYFFEAISAMIA
jgi:hypothetical protein